MPRKPLYSELARMLAFPLAEPRLPAGRFSRRRADRLRLKGHPGGGSMSSGSWNKSGPGTGFSPLSLPLNLFLIQSFGARFEARASRNEVCQNFHGFKALFRCSTLPLESYNRDSDGGVRYYNMRGIARYQSVHPVAYHTTGGICPRT